MNFADLIAVPNLMTIVVFVVVTGLIIAFYSIVRRLFRDPVRDRLEATQDERGPISGALLEGLAGQLPSSRMDNGALDQDLRRAGYYRPGSKSEFLAFRNALIFLVVFVAAGLAVFIGPGQQQLVMRILAIGAALAGLAWGIPRIYLRSQGNRRVARIRHGLPTALDMLTMCMSGGLSLEDSLAHVSREIYTAHHDLAIELVLVCKQAEMGSMERSLQQFARRVDAPEIVSMAAMVSQSQRLGTGLVDAMQAYADSLRLKWRHSADEQAGKSAVKLLFPVVLCLLPSIFLLLWGPSMLEMWDFVQQFEGVREINTTNGPGNNIREVFVSGMDVLSQ